MSFHPARSRPFPGRRTPAAGSISTDGTFAGRLRAMLGSPPRSLGTRGRVVAVTAARDFLGRHIVPLLAHDPSIERVVAIDIDHGPDRPLAKTTPKVRSYRVEAGSPLAAQRLGEIFVAERVDTLVHVGFLPTPSRASAFAHELESVGTRGVFMAARKASVRKVVMASQTLLYGARPENPSHLLETARLRPPDDPFFSDKVAAEAEAARFAEQASGATVTVLRLAPLLGPTVDTWLSRILALPAVPTLMGFDPLVQLLHEVDALAALKLATDVDAPGIFNIVGDGVLPISRIVRLLGKARLPLPEPAAAAALSALWLTSLSVVPRAFLPYLRYVCVADGTKARSVLGFHATHSAREAVLDFASADRLRSADLLSEAPR